METAREGWGQALASWTLAKSTLKSIHFIFSTHYVSKTNMIIKAAKHDHYPTTITTNSVDNNTRSAQ